MLKAFALDQQLAEALITATKRPCATASDEHLLDLENKALAYEREASGSGFAKKS